MASTDVLLRSFRLRSLDLPDRIVMAPMTRSKSPHQVPNEAVAAYYRARADGGAGLILTEGTSPEHRSASADANVPAFFGEASLAGCKLVVEAVRAPHGHIKPQLRRQGVSLPPAS